MYFVLFGLLVLFGKRKIGKGKREKLNYINIRVGGDECKYMTFSFNLQIITSAPTIAFINE